jgi:D-alanyl-lipoteichoic acid acyltransferase DltB (MBOAT superfamily)
MLFNSTEFIFAFVPVTVIIFFLLTRNWTARAGIAWLSLASLFFYGWWDIRYIPLLCASIVANFLVSRWILHSRLLSARFPRGFLVVGLAMNLMLLGFFKYTNFFISNLNETTGLGLFNPQIVLPLGISFFTFTQIAYLVDVSRGEAKEYNFLNYVLFVTFFPHLIAGPIIHHKEMMPQFANPGVGWVSSAVFSSGLVFFLIGLAKKTVLADSLSAFARPVFEGAAAGVEVTLFEAWTGLLAYTFQIYFDFSGYSDMAVGGALLFGIKLPLNFNSPYKAESIIEFWRRWHMTLSRFLRDYIYVPLGGNRKGRVRRYVNLLLTMLLGGLWHGAGWTYVIWGALHGCYLLVNHAWHAILSERGYDSRSQRSRLFHLASLLLTFLAVSIAWVFFRSDNVATALVILKGMIGLNGIVLPSQFLEWVPALQRFVTPAETVELLGNGTVIGTFEVLELLLLSFVLCWCFPPTQQLSLRQQALALVVGLPFTVQAVLFSHAPSEFIYFQF